MLRLFYEAGQRWAADDAPMMGAALAFYTVFSLGPVMMTVLGVAGLIFGEEAVSGELYGQIADLVGSKGAAAVQGVVQSASATGEGLLASLLSPVLFLFSATIVFTQLQLALNRIWRTRGPDAEEVAPPKPPEQESKLAWLFRAAIAFLRVRLLGFSIVVGAGFLLVVSLVVNALIVALARWLGGGAVTPLVWVLQTLVSLAVLAGVFATIYKLLPDADVDWIDVASGGLITAVLFTVGKFAISIYLGTSDLASSYGAAGAMILVLLWVYYSAQIFLYGAEVTWLWRQRRRARQAH